MKKCPFCAEEIQDTAIKCKHCREFLDGRSRAIPPPFPVVEEMKWYFKTSVIIIALCSVGPLALPLIWFRPQTSFGWKIGLTIATLLLSWLLYLATMKSIEVLWTAGGAGICVVGWESAVCLYDSPLHEGEGGRRPGEGGKLTNWQAE